MKATFLSLYLVGFLGISAFARERKSIVTAAENSAVGGAATYHLSLSRADVAPANSHFGAKPHGLAAHLMLGKGSISAVAASQESAAMHIKETASLLKKIDSYPGSYGHSQLQGGFRSHGDEKRSGNSDFKKAMYHLVKAKQLGMTADQAVMAALREFQGSTPKLLMEERQTSLLNNLKAMEKLGLDTPDNLTLLKDGKAPLVTRGSPRYVGQKAEVDHRVARSVAPQFENESANLQLLPGKLNREKLATHGKFEQEHALRLQRAYGRSIVLNRTVGAGGAAILVAVPFDVATQLIAEGRVDWSKVSGMGGLAAGSAVGGSLAGSTTTWMMMSKQVGPASASAANLLGLKSASRFANVSGGAVGGGVTAVLFAYGGYGLGYYDLETAHRSAIAGGVGAGMGAATSAVTFGLISTYATAGTGVAISSLSGASATSASLAWLGSGTVASGGFGAAGGWVVLTGGGAIIILGTTAAVLYGFQVYDEHQDNVRLDKTIGYLSRKKTFFQPDAQSNFAH